MRVLVKDFVRIARETLPAPAAVVEVGSFRVPGQEELADLRPLFKGSRYVGCDVRLGLGVDCVADVCAIPVRSGTVDMVLMLDTLEHVEFPREATQEIYRALALDGIVVISSVMCFPVHEYPCDFWRFTPQGFESLLKAFAWHKVWAVGYDDRLPHTVVGIGVKAELSPEAEARVIGAMERWRQKWVGHSELERRLRVRVSRYLGSRLRQLLVRFVRRPWVNGL